jgi:phosphoribosyl-ATP pyrophosphohydrolase
MSKSDKYQRFAEECLEIAQTAKDNQAKAVLLHMAQVWFRLAAEHAKHAKGG